MKYFIVENGQQAGPFDPDELLLHGLTPSSLVWCQGMADWIVASRVPELMALLDRQRFTPGGSDTQIMPQKSTTHQPYAQPQYYPDNTVYPQQIQTKTWLTESMIVTILAALCCCNPIGLLTGIYAIVKAKGAKNKAMVGDSLGSASDANVAKVWVIITACIIVAWILFIIFNVILNPSFLQHIQEGAVGSVYSN